MTSIRTLMLEMVDQNGASHIRELHIEILRDRPDTPEHTIRARLSEAEPGATLTLVGRARDEDGSSSVVIALVGGPGDDPAPVGAESEPEALRRAVRALCGELRTSANPQAGRTTAIRLRAHKQ